jgi:NitT/TauT family transport system ATP-binding protein
MAALRVVLHAPTRDSLDRARRNAANLLAERPDAEVRIVANGAGVAQALEHPSEATDGLLSLCRNSLNAQNLANPAGLSEVTAAVLTLAELQAEGWSYIRT